MHKHVRTAARSAVIALAIAFATGGHAAPSLPTVGIFPEDSLYNSDGSIRYFSQDVLLKQVGQTLVDSSPFGEYFPGLAKSWTFSPDRLSITFTLRQGLTFHSGQKVDAATVVRALNRRFYDDGNIIHETLARHLEGFDKGTATKTCPCLAALPEERITIRLSRPFNAMISLLSASNSVILNPDAGARDLLDGTGPYFLKRVDGAYFLMPFSGYQGNYPVSNDGFRVVVDSKNEGSVALIRQLKAASIDYAFTATAAVAKEASNPAYVMRPLPMMGRFGMYFNTRSPQMQDDDQRAALFDLLNRFLADHPLPGTQPADDIYPRGMIGYKPRLKSPSGTRRAFKGKVVTMTGIAKDIYGVQQSLSEYLTQFGVTLRYTFVSGDYVREFKTSEVDVFVMGNSDPYLDPSASIGLLMQMDLLAKKPVLAKEFQTLFDAGIAEVDVTKKIAKYSAIGTLVVDHHIYLPWAQPSVLEFFRATTGIAPPPTKYRYAPMLSELQVAGKGVGP